MQLHRSCFKIVVIIGIAHLNVALESSQLEHLLESSQLEYLLEQLFVAHQVISYGIGQEDAWQATRRGETTEEACKFEETQKAGVVQAWH